MEIAHGQPKRFDLFKVFVLTFEYLYDIIYNAESALWNINPLFFATNEII
jgi:hypothetical protein